MQKLGTFAPKRKTAVSNEEAWIVELAKLDGAILIGDDKGIAGFGAVRRQQKLHAAQLQHSGLWLLGLPHYFALQPQCREIELATWPRIQVVRAFDGVETRGKQLHFELPNIRRRTA